MRLRVKVAKAVNLTVMFTLLLSTFNIGNLNIPISLSESNELVDDLEDIFVDPEMNTQKPELGWVLDDLEKTSLI